VTRPADTFREVGAAAVMGAVVDRLGLPLFVKPAKGGSALGCARVDHVGDLPNAMVGCFAYGPVALVEQCIEGVEVSVPVVETGPAHEPVALPAVEIRPDGGVYDYTARYTAGATEFVVPAELDQSGAAECARVAELAHVSLGLRDLSRSDLIVDSDGVVWFLEVNVAPGMTETSLVPLAVEAAGLDLGGLFVDLAAGATLRLAGSV
jgi:D-alanine-D-alanine ligase